LTSSQGRTLRPSPSVTRLFLSASFFFALSSFPSYARPPQYHFYFIGPFFRPSLLLCAYCVGVPDLPKNCASFSFFQWDTWESEWFGLPSNPVPFSSASDLRLCLTIAFSNQDPSVNPTPRVPLEWPPPFPPTRVPKAFCGRFLPFFLSSSLPFSYTPPPLVYLLFYLLVGSLRLHPE